MAPGLSGQGGGRFLSEPLSPELHTFRKRRLPWTKNPVLLRYKEDYPHLYSAMPA